MTENLTLQNLLKNRNLLPAEKFGNILAFDKELKRKLQSLTSADSFIKNNWTYALRGSYEFGLSVRT